jgi:hypothetical protein
MLFAQGNPQTRGCFVSFWSAVRREMREVVWLASIVGGLSLLGVGLALAAALALDGWPARLLSHV